jgi:flavodoxin
MDVYFIYASTSGNVEIVVEFVSQIFRKKGLGTILCRSEQTNVDVVSKNHKFVFATSTWEHGRLNPFFDHLQEQMQTIDCLGKEAAFVGLGDRRYEPVLFCEGIEEVRRLWTKIGGRQIAKTLKIEGEPYNQLDPIVKPWAEAVERGWAKEHD